MSLILEDDMYIIAPSNLKKKILLEQAENHSFYRLSFASLQEVKEHYFFRVKEEATLFLLEQTDYTLDVIRQLLPVLYSLEDKTYTHPKLKQLQAIKALLEQQNLLEYDGDYKRYLKTKKVVVMGYPLLEPYEKKMLADLKATIIKPQAKYLLTTITHYNTLYEEVVGVAQAIRTLNQQQVAYHQIVLAGVDTSYYYTLQTIFSWFSIPLNLPKKYSIAQTIQGQNFLKELDITALTSDILKQKVQALLQTFSYAKNSPYYATLIADALQHTYLDVPLYQDAITIDSNVCTIADLCRDDQYVFVLGVNQNKIPAIYKDDDFLSDVAKQEVGQLCAAEKNKALKEATKLALQTIPHVFLSYKDTSLQEIFYPASMIEELNLTTIEPTIYPYQFSHTYNQYTLGLLLDQYYKYHEEASDLTKLLPYYNSLYQTYDHTYQKHFVTMPKLVLSYSQLDDYALCPFRYYAKYVLQLEAYQETFAQKIGTIYHQVLASMYQGSFDFDTSYNQAISTFDLTVKEKFLLKRLKNELAFIVEEVKEQEKNTTLTKVYVEKKLSLAGDKYLLKGFIDKILFCEKNGKTYYAFLDYKTGSVTLNFDYLAAGLHMQLPIYLYLIETSGLFNQPVFTGLFYQMLLKNSKNDVEKKQNLKLVGYVTAEEDNLVWLDENYEKSSWIKGLSVTKDGRLSAKSKVLSSEQKEQMKQLVKEKIDDFANAILAGEFAIAPKIVQQKNLSCQYCPFKEICFHDARDNQYLDSIKEEDHA